MNMHDLQQLLPKYQPELFADRQQALQRVIDVIEHRLRGEAQPILAFRGGRGLGKSWLSFHLSRTVIPAHFPDNVLCLFIGLGEAYRGRVIQENDRDRREWLLEDVQKKAAKHIQSPPAVLRNLLQWVAGHIEASRADDASSEQLAAWITQSLRELDSESRYQLLVCVVDSVYETNKELRDTLEQGLFDTLAQLPRVQLVLTGRGNRPSWNSHFLRHNEEPIDLGSLDEPPTAAVEVSSDRNALRADVKEKLLRALSALAGRTVEETELDALLLETNWLPLNTILAFLALQKEVNWEMALDELLRFVPSEQRLSLRETIVPLAVLQGFTDAEVIELLPFHFNGQSNPTTATERPESPEQPGYPITDTLLAYQLITWDSENAWYVLDQSVRSFALLYLKKVHLNNYHKLQRRAEQMYSSWANDYDDDFYRGLAQYHAGMLQQSETDSERDSS